jgi:hypothetical protein
MANPVHIAPQGGSISSQGAANRPYPTSHPIGNVQAAELGYGIGTALNRICLGCIDTFGNWWNKPSAEQLSKQRQLTIIRHQIRELIPELTSALNKIPKNSKDPRALNWSLRRIQKIASNHMSLLVPSEDESLRKYQTKQFKPLEERISKLQPLVKDKLRPLLPILFQNMKNAEKGMDGEEKKSGLNLQRTSEFNQERAPHQDKGSSLHQLQSGRSFPAAFNLADLNGNNGFIINGINSFDGSGQSVASAGDVNGDGIGDLIVGAPNTPSSGGAGQSYVFFGQKSSWSSPISPSSLKGANGFILSGINAGDGIGSSVASAGDVNGDGIGDLILGAREASPAGILGAGQSYVFFGSKSPMSSSFFSLSSLNGANGFMLNGINFRDESGTSVASAGDVNGDGIGDLIVGAPGASNFAGQSYVFFGSKNPWSSPISLSIINGTNGFILNGPFGSNSGVSVASAGDVNGDGISDLIVGAPEAGIYVVFGRKGPWNSPINLSSLNGANGFILNGNNFTGTGTSVASAGDVNGDGISDLIVGAPEAGALGAVNFAGQSYVVFGRKGQWNSPINLFSLNGANGFIINAINANDQIGTSVASAGDVNGDGIGDLILGAPSAASSSGESYVVLGSKGPWNSSFSLLSLNGVNGFVINGINANDQIGTSVASAGDVNGDGIGDLIVGAPGASNFAGQSYVVFGQRASTSSSTTTNTTTPSGSSTNIGAIVGGVLGGTLLIAAAATVVALKVLKKGCFAEKTTATPNRMNNQAIFNDDNL